MVRELDDDPVLRLVEGLRTSSLGHLEIAEALSEATEMTSMSQRGLADLVGLSQGRISKHLQLLGVNPAAQALVQTEQLPLDDAIGYSRPRRHRRSTRRTTRPA